MKKFIITIVILLSIFFDTKAQYQSIFGQNSTEWIFEWHNLGIDEQDTVYVEKDTIAFGHSWKKVKLKKYHSYFEGALIREDTIFGKVWYKGLKFVNSYDDTLEFLAFDFSLNLNDTFNIDNMYSGKGGTTTIDNTVDSIYYVSGIKHIRFKWILYSGWPKLEPFTLIEGIGGIMGILYKQYIGGLMAQYLLCSYKDGIQTYYTNKRYNGNCNIYPNSTEEYSELTKSIQIYPNPTSDYLNIGYNKIYSVLTKITLIDIQGKALKEQIKNQTIDVSDLPTGSYLIQLTFNNHFTAYKLFQKQ